MRGQYGDWEPGPASGEVARLESALRIEQARTERTLAALLPPTRPATGDTNHDVQ